MHKLIKLLFTFAICCYCLNATAAELDEVIVTAQKRSQSVNEIGITINTFTGEQLQDYGISAAEDIALFTPGLTINDTAATGVPLYSIRGVGFQDYSTGASSTVGLYFDEVNIPYTVMSRGAVFDVQRMEVLKGPQGDLYGRNTTAGQINFVSNEPTEQFESNIRLGYGSFSTVDAEGFISGPFTDNIQARFAFKTVQSSEGWQKSLTRDDELGEKDVNAFRTLLNFDINENASLLFRLHYVKDKSDNRATTAYDGRRAGLGSVSNAHLPLQDFTNDRGSFVVTTLHTTPPWFSVGDPEAADWTNSYTSPITNDTFDLRPQRDNELKGLSAKLEWDINDIALTSIIAYDDFERQESNDWDGGAFNDSSNINTTGVDVFSWETRVSGELNNFNWLGGIYYSKDELDEFYHYFFSDSRFALAAGPFNIPGAPFAAFPIRELHTRYNQETDSKAIFGHVEWSVTEQSNLTIGLRYTDEERTWTGCTFSADDNSLGAFLNAAFGTTLQAGDCGTVNDDLNSPNNFFTAAAEGRANDAFQEFTDTLDTQRWMGKIGVDHQLNDDTLLYATLSQGFKSGGYNGANTNTTQQIGPYNEEILTAYEIGAKSTLLDNSMQLNTALFYYDYKDKQEQDLAVTFVGNISGLTNIPRSRILGAELDMQWLVTDRLDTSFRLAWLDTEIKEWQITSSDSYFCAVVGSAATGNCANPGSVVGANVITIDASGTELPQAPTWSVNALANYRLFDHDSWHSIISADINFKDSTEGVLNQPENATESYTIINARLSFNDNQDRWRAQLWVRNLSDEYYYASAFRGGNGPFVRVNGLPRTVGINVQYNF